MESEKLIDSEKPYIKLYRNQTAKGKIYYNWEIKTYSQSTSELIPELEKLNNELITTFPNSDGGIIE
jgi:hypothetical protein